MGFARGEIGSLSGLVVVRRIDLDGFHGEGLCGVLREHRDDDVIDDFGFCFVGSCDVDENVSSFGADFRVVRIYDWGHRADCSVGIEDDWVYRGVSDYVKVAREMSVILQ